MHEHCKLSRDPRVCNCERLHCLSSAFGRTILYRPNTPHPSIHCNTPRTPTWGAMRSPYQDYFYQFRPCWDSTVPDLCQLITDARKPLHCASTCSTARRSCPQRSLPMASKECRCRGRSGLACRHRPRTESCWIRCDRFLFLISNLAPHPIGPTYR